MTSSRIWPATDGPNNEDNGDPVTLGTRFTLSATGWITHLHFFRGTTNDTGTHTGGVFKKSDSSPVAGTQITIPAVGTGWQTVALPVPVQVPADTYVAGALHPDGHPCFTGGYWGVGGPGGSGITNGILTAPSDAAISGQGVYVGGGTFACPTNSFNQANYWVDVTVSDVDPVGRTGTGATSATAALASTGAKSSSGTGALTATGTLTSTGNKGGRGTGALAGTSSVASTGRKDGTGTGALSGTAALTGTGSSQRTGTGSLTAVAGLAGTGQTHRSGTGALTAVATLASSGHNADDVLPDWTFRIGPPETGWRVGPPAHLRRPR